MARKPPVITPDTYLTSHEVANYTQFNPSTINKWVKENLIPAFRTPGGHRRIKVADLLAFLREHEMPIPKALDAGEPLADPHVFAFPKSERKKKLARKK
jgi:excisionase family DNA binding protein